MKFFLISLILLSSTLVAEVVPKWAQMQTAILVEPDLIKIKNLVVSGFDPNSSIGCGTFAPLNGAIHKQNSALVDLLISLESAIGLFLPFFWPKVSSKPAIRIMTKR